jgi:hypothetical protein
MQSCPPESIDRARQYCREARRARARWGHDRGRMVGELAALSRREDVAAKLQKIAARPRPIVVQALAYPLVSGSAFAELVESRMIGGVLTYSMRRSLLAMAPRYGIGRFEANLAIAAVQYRQNPDAARRRATGVAAVRSANVASEGAKTQSIPPARWKGYFGWAELLTVLALQGALCLCLWHWIG